MKLVALSLLCFRSNFAWSVAATENSRVLRRSAVIVATFVGVSVPSATLEGSLPERCGRAAETRAYSRAAVRPKSGRRATRRYQCGSRTYGKQEGIVGKLRVVVAHDS